MCNQYQIINEIFCVRFFILSPLQSSVNFILIVYLRLTTFKCLIATLKTVICYKQAL